MLEYELDLSPESVSRESHADSGVAELPFVVRSCGSFCAGERFYMRTSGRECAEILYTLSGEGKLVNETTGQTCALTPGSAAFLPGSGDALCYRPTSAEPWAFKWLRLDGSGLTGYRVMLGRGPAAPIVQEPEVFVGHIDAILRSIGQNLTTARAAEAAHVAALLSAIADEVVGAWEDDAISAIVREIRRNPERHYAIKDLARRAGMNQYSFIRVFKEEMGFTPYQYVLRARVRKAMRLLRGDTTVEAVAGACGFYDAPSFIRCFSKMTGLTPSEYRRMGDAFFALHKPGEDW